MQRLGGRFLLALAGSVASARLGTAVPGLGQFAVRADAGLGVHAPE
jgi:hypothetical protein